MKKRYILPQFGVMSEGITTFIADTSWFRSLNTFSSEVSKAMDRGFITERLTGLTPNNHRILDGGHDFFSSIDRAREVGAKNGWDNEEVFNQWAQAYFTDLSSPAGVPLFGKLSDDFYKLLKSIGVSDKEAADFVTINGQEALENILAGTISSVSLLFAWTKKDKEAFSQSVGLILTSGVASFTPVAIVMGITAMALGYERLFCGKALSKGIIKAALILSISAAIPGPTILGVLAGLYVSVKIQGISAPDFKLNPFRLKPSRIWAWHR